MINIWFKISILKKMKIYTLLIGSEIIEEYFSIQIYKTWI